MKERIAKFMAGRYGNDQLGRALLILDVILLLLASIFSKTLGGLFTPLAVALLVFIYYRMLSKNIYKRQEENGKYLRLKYKVTARLNVVRERWVQRKEYKFFTSACPQRQRKDKNSLPQVRHVVRRQVLICSAIL